MSRFRSSLKFSLCEDLLDIGVKSWDMYDLILHSIGEDRIDIDLRENYPVPFLPLFIGNLTDSQLMAIVDQPSRVEPSDPILTYWMMREATGLLPPPLGEHGRHREWVLYRGAYETAPGTPQDCELPGSSEKLLQSGLHGQGPASKY